MRMLRRSLVTAALIMTVLVSFHSAKPLLFKSENSTTTATAGWLSKLSHARSSLAHTLSKGGSALALQKKLILEMWQRHGLHKMTCEVCKVGVGFLQELLSFGWSDEEVSKAIRDVCIISHKEDTRVCTGLVNMFKGEVLTVFDDLALNPNELCGLVYGDSCAKPYWPFDSWNVSLPDIPKPPVVPKVLPKPGSPTMRVLHLTDIHLDAMYSVGSKATCSEPLCCRASDGKPGSLFTEPGDHGAGHYGDYRNCDTPTWTLEGLFSHLSTQKFDYILWTGDLPAHNIWNQSRIAQTSILKNLTAMVEHYFPKTPVFPALGNHESSPVNSFPPRDITGNQSISWLYDALAETWSHWLPADVLPSVRKGGYYSFSPFPGFRIISVNTNACNNMNWWLLLNTTDPDGQLSWLIDTLQKAEDKKEKVHIIGHIPPGIDDCLKSWSRNFYKIVDRYESTISGQFYGHTHHDHFEVFYDVATLTRPTSVAYISPSVTPFSNLNMGYRIFTIDGNYSGSSWEVLDHETHILNLTSANMLKSAPVWQLEYTAKAKYGMKSMFPQDWNNLITRMTTDNSLLQTFYTYYYKSHISGPCDSYCAADLLCALKSGKSHSTATFCPEVSGSAVKQRKRSTKMC